MQVLKFEIVNCKKKLTERKLCMKVPKISRRRKIQKLEQKLEQILEQK